MKKRAVNLRIVTALLFDYFLTTFFRDSKGSEVFKKHEKPHRKANFKGIYVLLKPYQK